MATLEELMGELLNTLQQIEEDKEHTGIVLLTARTILKLYEGES